MKTDFDHFHECTMEIERFCYALHDEHEFGANIISLSLLHFLICHSDKTATEWRSFFKDFCDEMEANDEQGHIH